jgi:hypothetical protein
MHSPYTEQPAEAFQIAQTSLGLVLTAVTWSRPSRPAASSWVLVAAIWWVVLVPFQHAILGQFGVVLPPRAFENSLKAATMLATLAAVLTGRPGTIAFAIAANIALVSITNHVVDSGYELTALHLAYLGALVGLQARARDQDVAAARPGTWAAAPASESGSFRAHDLRFFALAMLLAMAVSIFVLEQSTDSSDEWAYTFQAAVFAKGRAYADSPACGPAFRNFWVWDWSGRQFAQYTPGWPLFMVPFSWLHVPQFAAAASLGLFVVGVARLARRAARASGYAPRAVAAAGTFAALCSTLASTLVVNGASRFGHVFAAALLAWSIEAVCAAVDASRAGARQSEVRWSVAFGSLAALLWATRPGDGTASALGLGLYAMYALFGRQVSWRAVAGAAAGAAFVAGVTLVILRLQLGVWFKTGYSLTSTFYPWNRVAFSWPKLGEWKYGFPLATGAYCWWPLSPALGIAGLVMLRDGGRRIAFMLGVGAIALFLLLSLFEMGRGSDWGYGPRYSLPTTAAMAVGTGVALAPLWVRARRKVGAVGSMPAGPVTLALLGIVLGVVRLVPLVYPANTAGIRALNALNAEIRREHLHHAMVLLPSGVGWMNEGLDLTMNLPVSLYPDQDVLVAMDKTPALTECLRTHYADRAFYTALPGSPVKITKR